MKITSIDTDGKKEVFDVSDKTFDKLKINILGNLMLDMLFGEGSNCEVTFERKFTDSKLRKSAENVGDHDHKI